ncbi:HAMP domain-containing histidine kinase [Actinocorallia sp. API 0066]|uniref:sensor histidine kinase n=1 Tax=Actinocorallia sp. API 0066 TaxID=2896846 RepID=UPI001E4BD922|nr:HAMP domain-containing sensor histidine kinase [Actinocorallia sp. API 0066]MCD0450558.1 HAMP domain-containing histidine kinase [Actinocorallia sp. API 0066]
MRWWPRSIRVRDTLLAALLGLIVSALMAVGVMFFFRQAILGQIFGSAERAAFRTVGDVRADRIVDPLRSVDGVHLIQVLDTSGRVVAATPEAHTEPLSQLRPPPDDRVDRRVECRHGECHAVVAVRSVVDEDTDFVIAAVRLPSMLVGRGLDLAAGLGVVGITGLAAWSTWIIVGRTLGPIEAIRRQMSEISASDLHRRVPEPHGDDEIARLARTSNETLERLERAVDRQRQFASDASHELRTPIAGLRTNLEGALLHPDDADWEDVAKAALRDTDRLETIITDLLLLSQLGAGTSVPEGFDLGELARLESRPGVEVEAPERVCVHGVRFQFARLYANLLDNAEQYGHGETRVTVRRDGPEAVLAVRDNGPGIPAEDRERIFERFSRLDTARSRAAGGTGLGLAIARDIARSHGGELTVADVPSGACFVLRLPLVDHEGPSEEGGKRA